MSDETTIGRIQPIVFRIYGGGPMAQALANELAKKIDAWPDVPRRAGARREDMVRMTCWNRFSGHTTAVGAAKRIEAALDEGHA